MKRTIITIGLCLLASSAFAEDGVSDGKIKIGVLTDMSGPYAESTGQGSVEAVRMAVEELANKVAGTSIELVSADHQNKPDIAASIANKWIDVDQVDVIVDVPNSAAALAIQDITRKKNRILLASGGGTAQLTGPSCSPTTAQWTYDTFALSQVMGRAGVQKLGDTWYFLTVDYAFGHALESDLSAVLAANGARVVGRVRHPLNTADFSSYLLQAQASGAKVVALANAGGDTATAIKQAQEFGLPQSGQTMASLLMFPTDIQALGLPAAQGLVFPYGWYADRDAESRAFAKAFITRTGRMPSMIQVGAYSAVRHYLRAIDATKTDKADAVMAQMRKEPINDAFAKGGTLRPDGRMVHDMYLMQVKKPEDSTGNWDFSNVLSTIPGQEAFRPLNAGGCPLTQ